MNYFLRFFEVEQGNNYDLINFIFFCDFCGFLKYIMENFVNFKDKKCV